MRAFLQSARRTVSSLYPAAAANDSVMTSRSAKSSVRGFFNLLQNIIEQGTVALADLLKLHAHGAVLRRVSHVPSSATLTS